MLKDHNRSTRIGWEIRLKLTIMKPEWHHGTWYDVFIVNVTYFTRYCRVSIVDFDQENLC